MINAGHDFMKKGKLIYIRKPEFNELDYVSLLWADEDTMKDVGGAIQFPEERRKGWYSKMVYPADGRNFYCLIYNMEDIPVGEVSFHRYNIENKTAEFNVKVQSKYRHRGYGKEAIKLMLDYYFFEFGGEVMMDDVINVNGQKALAKFGFEILSRSRESILFRMTKERYMHLMGIRP